MAAIASSSWIVGPRDDLVFFSGSAILGYCVLLVAFALGDLPTRFLVAFAFAIDGPHVYSTLTRAFFDRDERKRLRWAWYVALPICVLVCPLLAFFLGDSGFLVVIATLSHFHISKQHMGFTMIYKRKAVERSDYKLDKYFALVSLILPFGFYLSSLALGSTYLLPLFLVPALAFGVVYAWRQLNYKNINTPKLMLLLAFIPLQWCAWGYAALEPGSMSRLITAAVACNVGHSLQYLRLTYFHNHNRYAEGRGLLSLISRKWIYFLAASIVLASPAQFLLPASQPVIASVAVGVLFFHFVLDSRIWRIRGNPELARALKLN